MSSTIAMILAGGQGRRLSILADQRAKPAVPFGSNYRIIDFTISNVMNSGIRYLGVLTQYKPYSLMAHIGMGEAWGLSGRRSAAKILSPYVGDSDSDWYAGTADAIYQNLSFTDRFDPDTVVVLSGDHIYNMAYGELLTFHHQSRADLTIATQPVPWEDAHRFGVLKLNEGGRIEAFQEKPSDPVSNQANLGIYVFRYDVLKKYLRDDAADPDSNHDFGKDIIPRMTRECECYALPFEDYWRDVGTLQSFWDANMDCLDPQSGLDLDNWGVRTNWMNIPAAYTGAVRVHRGGHVVHSVVGRGSSIRGTVINSILFHGAQVGEGATVRDSIIMDGTSIGPGAQVNRVIADKHSRVGAGASVGGGEGAPPNKRYPDYLKTGLTLVGKHADIPPDARIGANCLIHPNIRPEHFGDGLIPSGATLDADSHGKN